MGTHLAKLIPGWSFDCETLKAQAKRRPPQTYGHADDHCQLVNFGSHARQGDFHVSHAADSAVTGSFTKPSARFLCRLWTCEWLQLEISFN